MKAAMPPRHAGKCRSHARPTDANHFPIKWKLRADFTPEILFDELSDDSGSLESSPEGMELVES